MNSSNISMVNKNPIVVVKISNTNKSRGLISVYTDPDVVPPLKSNDVHQNIKKKMLNNQ